MHASKGLTDFSKLHNTKHCVTVGNIKMESTSHIQKSIIHAATMTESVNALEISVMQ